MKNLLITIVIAVSLGILTGCITYTKANSNNNSPVPSATVESVIETEDEIETTTQKPKETTTQKPTTQKPTTQQPTTQQPTTQQPTTQQPTTQQPTTQQPTTQPTNQSTNTEHHDDATHRETSDTSEATTQMTYTYEAKCGCGRIIRATSTSVKDATSKVVRAMDEHWETEKCVGVGYYTSRPVANDYDD